MNNFTRHDAEKLESLTVNVEKWRLKAGLTTLDLLVACRFALANKFDWEESIEAAVDRHSQYVAYYDTGRNEEDARDRRIAALEAEVARLVQVNASLEIDNEMMRARAYRSNGIGRTASIRG